MKPRVIATPGRRALRCAALLAALAVALPAVAATTEPSAKRQAEVSVLSLDVAGGKWTFVGRGVSLKDTAAEIARKAPIDVRIATPELEAVVLGVKFDGIATKDAMTAILAGFNFAQFDDPKTGRQVYLVTSLATEVKPVAPERKTTTVVASAPASSGSSSVTRARSLDDFRPVKPATIKSREQSQAEIEADYKREREEKLARAIDALRSKDASGAVQQQAIADLAASDDPRATAALRDAWNQVQGMPSVSPYVAQSVWRNAAQQQFNNNDANALLLSFVSSTNPAVRAVGEAAKVDMERYRAAQNKP